MRVFISLHHADKASYSSLTLLLSHRSEYQDATTVHRKLNGRPLSERKRTRISHGDCLPILSQMQSNSYDAASCLMYFSLWIRL